MSECIDDLFEALSSARRRQVLLALLDGGPSAELAVPDDIAADGVDIQTLQIELIHQDLPKLEEMGFLQWDRDAGTVTRGAEFGTVADALADLRDHQTVPVAEST